MSRLSWLSYRHLDNTIRGFVKYFPIFTLLDQLLRGQKLECLAFSFSYLVTNFSILLIFFVDFANIKQWSEIVILLSM
jgi:hypothetical protein